MTSRTFWWPCSTQKRHKNNNNGNSLQIQAEINLNRKRAGTEIANAVLVGLLATRDDERTWAGMHAFSSRSPLMVNTYLLVTDFKRSRPHQHVFFCPPSCQHPPAQAGGEHHSACERLVQYSTVALPEASHDQCTLASKIVSALHCAATPDTRNFILRWKAYLCFYVWVVLVLPFELSLLGYWPTEAVTGDREFCVDSGEGA